MGLGLTSVTFRKLTTDEITALAAEAGCDIIEWGGDIHVRDKEDAAYVRKMCTDAGIGINSYGSYYRLGQGAQESFEPLCEIAKILDAKTLRVWLGNKGSAMTGERLFEKLAAEAERLSDTAQKYALTVAFEFHTGTYNDTGESSRRFIERIGRENIKTYWQPMFAGRDIENLKNVISDTVTVHMFNWNRLGVRYPLRKGKAKIREFLDILKSDGYAGDVILEFVKGDRPENFLSDFKCLKEWY